MKRTEKDLHISSFHLNFAAKCKKTAHKCCNFQKKWVTETQKQLANFNEDLSKVLSHSGFWCTSKVFAWLLGIFGFCLFVTFMTIALLIAGNLQFRVY